MPSTCRFCLHDTLAKDYLFQIPKTCFFTPNMHRAKAIYLCCALISEPRCLSHNTVKHIYQLCLYFLTHGHHLGRLGKVVSAFLAGVSAQSMNLYDKQDLSKAIAILNAHNQDPFWRTWSLWPGHRFSKPARRIK